MKKITLSVLVIIAALFLLNCQSNAEQGPPEEKSIGKAALIIKDVNSVDDINVKEQQYLEANFGTVNEDWIAYEEEPLEQDGRHYDKVTIKLADSGELKAIYFDITQPFDQFNPPEEEY